VTLSPAVMLASAALLPTVPPNTTRPLLPVPNVKANAPFKVPFNVKTLAAMLVPIVVAEPNVILPFHCDPVAPILSNAPTPPTPEPFKVRAIAAGVKLAPVIASVAPLVTVTPEVKLVALPNA